MAVTLENDVVKLKGFLYSKTVDLQDIVWIHQGKFTSYNSNRIAGGTMASTVTFYLRNGKKIKFRYNVDLFGVEVAEAIQQILQKSPDIWKSSDGHSQEYKQEYKNYYSEWSKEYKERR